MLLFKDKQKVGSEEKNLLEIQHFLQGSNNLLPW